MKSDYRGILEQGAKRDPAGIVGRQKHQGSLLRDVLVRRFDVEWQPRGGMAASNLLDLPAQEAKRRHVTIEGLLSRTDLIAIETIPFPGFRWKYSGGRSVAGAGLF